MSPSKTHQRLFAVLGIETQASPGPTGLPTALVPHGVRSGLLLVSPVAPQLLWAGAALSLAPEAAGRGASSTVFVDEHARWVLAAGQAD